MNLKEKIDIQLKECIKAFNIVLDDSIKHNNDNILNCDVNIDFLERHAKEIVFICENMRSFKKLEKKYLK